MFGKSHPSHIDQNSQDKERPINFCLSKRLWITQSDGIEEVQNAIRSSGASLQHLHIKALVISKHKKTVGEMRRNIREMETYDLQCSHDHPEASRWRPRAHRRKHLLHARL